MFGYGYEDESGKDVPFYIDMINGGGPGRSGPEFEGGGILSLIANALFSPYGSAARERAAQEGGTGMMAPDIVLPQSLPRTSVPFPEDIVTTLLYVIIPGRFDRPENPARGRPPSSGVLPSTAYEPMGRGMTAPSSGVLPSTAYEPMGRGMTAPSSGVLPTADYEPLRYEPPLPGPDYFDTPRPDKDESRRMAALTDGVLPTADYEPVGGSKIMSDANVQTLNYAATLPEGVLPQSVLPLLLNKPLNSELSSGEQMLMNVVRTIVQNYARREGSEDVSRFQDGGSIETDPLLARIREQQRRNADLLARADEILGPSSASQPNQVGSLDSQERMSLIDEALAASARRASSERIAQAQARAGVLPTAGSEPMGSGMAARTDGVLPDGSMEPMRYEPPPVTDDYFLPYAPLPTQEDLDMRYAQELRRRDGEDGYLALPTQEDLDMRYAQELRRRDGGDGYLALPTQEDLDMRYAQELRRRDGGDAPRSSGVLPTRDNEPLTGDYNLAPAPYETPPTLTEQDLATLARAERTGAAPPALVSMFNGIPTGTCLSDQETMILRALRQAAR